MNTVKHLNSSSLQSLQKKQFRFLSKLELICMVFTLILVTVINNYLVKEKVIDFPLRPFPEIFSINIFMIAGLPLLVLLYLRTLSLLDHRGKAGVILFGSLLMTVFEKLFEVFGVYGHSAKWEHIYTFVGYMFFLSLLTLLTERIRNRSK